MREVQVERALVAAARAAGGLAAKHTSPGRAGDPDRIVVAPATLCPTCGSRCGLALVEVKAPGETPRPLQRQRIAEWRSLGVMAGWVGGVSQVDALIAQIAGRAGEAIGAPL